MVVIQRIGTVNILLRPAESATKNEEEREDDGCWTETTEGVISDLGLYSIYITWMFKLKRGSMYESMWHGWFCLIEARFRYRTPDMGVDPDCRYTLADVLNASGPPTKNSYQVYSLSGLRQIFLSRGLQYSRTLGIGWKIAKNSDNSLVAFGIKQLITAGVDHAASKWVWGAKRDANVDELT